MKRSLWVLLVATCVGIAFGDEKEPSVLSLDSTESFSLDFDTEPLVFSSKEAENEGIPWLGIWLQDTDALEQALEGEGVRIFAVAPLGPAYKAGLRKSDVITHWNAEEVTDADALRVRIKAMKIGEEVNLALHRNKKPQKNKIKAEDRAEYPWWEEWQPYLPTFEVAGEVNSLFQEHDEELEAMKAKFEEAEKASRKDTEQQKDGGSEEPADQ